MGTLQNGLIDIFRSIVQAAIGLKKLQFVLAVGGQLDPKQLGAVPANVMVVSYAPQIEGPQTQFSVHHSRGVEHCP